MLEPQGLSAEAYDGRPAVAVVEKEKEKVEPTEVPSTPETDSADLINAGTYAFAFTAGNVLEDMTGSRVLLPADADDAATPIAPIGFEFWYERAPDPVLVNANGLRGSSPLSARRSTTVPRPLRQRPTRRRRPTRRSLDRQQRKGPLQVVGAAPTASWWSSGRTCRFPRGGCHDRRRTFQAWLSESTGVIEFVYGMGMAANDEQRSVRRSLHRSRILRERDGGKHEHVCPTPRRTTRTLSRFPPGPSTPSPNAPIAPTGLNFTAVGLNGMTLN